MLYKNAVLQQLLYAEDTIFQVQKLQVGLTPHLQQPCRSAVGNTYKNFGIISTDAADHNLLANDYIQTMASFIENYTFTHNILIPANHNNSIQDRKAYFETLSWGGLTGTQAFDQKYKNSQGQLTPAGERVLSIIHADDHYIANTSTTGGNNCPYGECSTQKLCQ